MSNSSKLTAESDLRDLAQAALGALGDIHTIRASSNGAIVRGILNGIVAQGEDVRIGADERNWLKYLSDTIASCRQNASSPDGYAARVQEESNVNHLITALHTRRLVVDVPPEKLVDQQPSKHVRHIG